MAKRFHKQVWRVRKARRLNSFPVVLNGDGEEVCGVYMGDDCAAYIAALPRFHACLKATVKALAGSNSGALKAARELLAAHA